MADPEHSNATQLAGTETTNLYSAIDRDNVHGLNLTVPEDARALIKPWADREDDERYAESGVDDQIVIHIPFIQQVRLRSLLLKSGRGELTPTRLRVYANHSSIIDFSDAQSVKPQMNISLLEGQTTVTEYPLRVATFGNVTSLSLFFSDAAGDETTRLYYIGFKGDVRGAIREVGNRLEVPAPNAADASLIDKVTEKSARNTTIR